MKNKKEKLLVLFTVAILVVVAIFSAINRETIVYLFKEMIVGVAILKEYVRSLGIIGVLVISLIIIICFFVPVISSIPVQLASAVSYGLLFGFVHVVLSIFLASQLAFLFTRSIRIFQTQKQREKQMKMEEKINNSSRSIVHFLLLAYLAPFVPFMIIHIIAANSGMKWWKYSLVTLFGPMPDIIITLWLGNKITTASSPMVSYIILIIVVVCVVSSLIYKEKIVDLIFKPRTEGKKKNGK